MGNYFLDTQYGEAPGLYAAKQLLTGSLANIALLKFNPLQYSEIENNMVPDPLI